MKHLTVFALTIVCAFGLIGCSQAPTDDQPTKKSLSEIALDMPLAPTTEVGVGVELIYESDDRIIFYGEFGLFGYDLNAKDFLFSIDFLKAVGEQGAVQGSHGAVASASKDGKTIILYEYDITDGVIGEACYVDVPTLTYATGEYRPLEDPFQNDAANGYIMSAIELETVRYILDNKVWHLWGDK